MIARIAAIATLAAFLGAAATATADETFKARLQPRPGGAGRHRSRHDGQVRDPVQQDLTAGEFTLSVDNGIR